MWHTQASDDTLRNPETTEVKRSSGANSKGQDFIVLYCWRLRMVSPPLSLDSSFARPCTTEYHLNCHVNLRFGLASRPVVFRNAGSTCLFASTCIFLSPRLFVCFCLAASPLLSPGVFHRGSLVFAAVITLFLNQTYCFVLLTQPDLNY